MKSSIDCCALLKTDNTIPIIIDITVPFKPTPWKRPAGKAVRYDSQVNEKAAFAILAISEIRKQGISLKAGFPLFPNNTPLQVSLFFSFKPKKSEKIDTDYPRADVDNLAKFVLDALQSQALTGCIWHDDTQVNKLISEKCYGTEDCIKITIERKR